MTIQEWAAELEDLTPEERLETLIELAEGLPPLSQGRSAQPFPESCRVQECQTPVYMWVEVCDGRVALEADVPRKSPTVRGLVALLVESLNGQPVEVVRRLPDDLLQELHLAEVLGMTRQQGFAGLVGRIRHQVETAVAN